MRRVHCADHVGATVASRANAMRQATNSLPLIRGGLGWGLRLRLIPLVRERILVPAAKIFAMLIVSVFILNTSCTKLRRISETRIPVTQLSDEGAMVVSENGKIVDLDGDAFRSARDHARPDEFTGRAIVVRNAKNVTIKNATISGFKIAIYAENCPNLTIENCDVSNNYRQRLKSTPEKEDESDWLYGHENDNDEWLRYGGGIFLKNCPNATIKNCRARNGQNGICLVRCDEATVTDCDMSFMSGWGLAMWRSSKCKIIGNRFDYCVRGYSHGVYARGQDSTGILVYEQSSDNIFAFNHATHGGDGFFLYAGNETVNKTGEGGCNRNLVYMNDFSYAVANGIEATFSDQNVFLGNKLNHCEHGLWGGYSARSVISTNQIADCKHGVSMEHGRHNVIINNYVKRCQNGLHIWWDEDKELLATPYCTKQGCDSAGECLRFNSITECQTALLSESSKDVKCGQNQFFNNGRNVELLGTTTFGEFDANEIYGGLLSNRTQTTLIGARNYLDDAVKKDGPIKLNDATREPEIVSRSAASALVMNQGAELMACLQLANPKAFAKLPNRMGTSRLTELPNIPEGKQHILIDEWGPYDFASPKLTPLHATCWGTSKLRVLGTGQPFKIEALSAGISAAPMSGVAPAEITLRGADPNSSMIPYDVKLSLDGKPVRATGTLWQADWAVVYHTWDGSTDPRKGEEFWRRGRNFKPPILKENRDRIDFHWGGGGPTPDAKDHFALVTTTTLTLPAGQWRLRTISDDGVRVYVDKKKVIDNWTWHIPTEDKADVNVSEGPHEFRIEYFEIDGNAQLQFMIEPVPPATSQPTS